MYLATSQNKRFIVKTSFTISCFLFFRGNSLLVGAVGSHLTTLCQLALHVADVQVLRIDTSKQSNFFDGLRSAVRLTGSEGKILTLMFTVSHESYLALCKYYKKLTLCFKS